MSLPKTPSLTILVKVYEDDALMMDRVSAVAVLEEWKGDWSSRAHVIRNILARFIERLPPDSYSMLMMSATS